MGAVLCTLGTLAACGGSEGSDAPDTSLYALVEGIDGVYFYPPLGPEPAAKGIFDATLLDGISVSIESEDPHGVVTPLATFVPPAVALLAERERYWVNIAAASYLTDPSLTYRIRASLDGNELGTSVLSAKVFKVMEYNPALPIGVHLRIEGTGAVRAIRRQRASGMPRHCSDGVRNKDETGVDCGGAHCGPYSPAQGEEITATLKVRCTDFYRCGTEWRWTQTCNDLIPAIATTAECIDYHVNYIDVSGIYILHQIEGTRIDCGWHVVEERVEWPHGPYDWPLSTCTFESVDFHFYGDPPPLGHWTRGTHDRGGYFACPTGNPSDFLSVGCIVDERCPDGWTMRLRVDGNKECFRPLCPPPSVPMGGQCLCP